jgi:N4-gp56 family major capsid protein
VPDVYTGQNTLDIVQGAFDLQAYFALRPELYFAAAADVMPSNQSYPGKTVQFYIQSDLATASTTLSESSDVSAVAMADTTVVLTIAEYGNAIITTAFMRGTSFLDTDRLVTNVLGFNAGVSIDTLARDILKAGTNVNYSTGTGAAPTARNMITPLNTIGAADIRNARATLTRGNVQRIGGYYLAFIHPDVSYDLMGQTGTNTWSDPHAYSAPDNIWDSELGAFQGFRFVESPRAPVFADAGSSTTDTDVYRTICMGRQALAKAYSYVDGNGEDPTIVPGPITDKLRRQVPWGWYWQGVFGVFRQTALLGIESASSIGLNTVAGSH